MYDTIIIGAGMSGLAAGIRLAHFGKRVCILERHSAIGGLNSFYRQRGRTYDVGLHALTNYAPKGTRQRSAGPAAAAASPGLGGMGAGAAAWLGHCRFPAPRCSSPTTSSCSKPRCGGSFPAQIDNLRRLVRELRDYDQFGQAGAGRSARQVLGEHHRRAAAWSRCFSARSSSMAARASTTSISTSSASCFARFFWKGWPGPWPESN